ncbi:MAG TPA: alpha/beta hydrolase [Stellaceae bacterium]|jgi:arylformamidase
MSEIATVSRRGFLGAAVALAATPALGAECRLGPAPHEKGPLVFLNYDQVALDYDQVALDAAYDQSVYECNVGQIGARAASNSDAVRARLGEPERVVYGPTAIEHLDIYRAKQAHAPIFIFIHGGTWRTGSARDSAAPAELFHDHGAHYIALDFTNVLDAGGDLRPMAQQVRSAIAWVAKHAASFGGDPHRLYIGGHSSGGHLAGVAMVTDWQKDFGLPADTVKGGICISGMYEMKPVRLSARGNYVKFDDAMEAAMSAIRHLPLLRAPATVAYGTFETPEFQRQGRDFAKAAVAAGKRVTLIEAKNYAHMEIGESLANPYGPAGRAALAMMGLGRA